MNNLTPWLVLFSVCCVSPVVFFALGAWLARHGSPVQITWRGEKLSRRGGPRAPVQPYASDDLPD